jgi:hypothetical protein
MFIEFSEKDILRGKLIQPGFYRVRIDDVKEGLSKNGDSTNWVIDGTILFNADNGDKSFEGCPTPYWNFNSKAPGFFLGILAALGTVPEPGKRYDPKGLKGKEVDIMITNELYEGRMVNRVPHQYRAPRNVEATAEVSSVE